MCCIALEPSLCPLAAPVAPLILCLSTSPSPTLARRPSPRLHRPLLRALWGWTAAIPPWCGLVEGEGGLGRRGGYSLPPELAPTPLPHPLHPFFLLHNHRFGPRRLCAGEIGAPSGLERVLSFSFVRSFVRCLAAKVQRLPSRDSLLRVCQARRGLALAQYRLRAANGLALQWPPYLRATARHASRFLTRQSAFASCECQRLQHKPCSEAVVVCVGGEAAFARGMARPASKSTDAHSRALTDMKAGRGALSLTQPTEQQPRRRQRRSRAHRIRKPLAVPPPAWPRRPGRQGRRRRRPSCQSSRSSSR